MCNFDFPKGFQITFFLMEKTYIDLICGNSIIFIYIILYIKKGKNI